MSSDNLRSFFEKKQNPFERIRTQTDKYKENEKEKDSYAKFDNYNPFKGLTQENNNPFIKDIFSNNIKLKNEIKEDSQKKFINNIGINPITPDDSIINNKKNLNIKNDILINNKEKLNENNEFKLDYQKNHNSPLKSIPNVKSNNIYVIGKKITNTNDSKKNNLPIYDRDSDILNVDNLNKIIEISELNKKPITKEILPDSIDSNLGIIKEEQNESDKELGAFQKNNLNSEKKISNINENNNLDLISIDKMMEESVNEEEIENIVKKNYDQIDSLLSTYNINIINDIIDTNINTFKIEVDKFLLDSKKTIDKLKILDDIQKRVKEKLIVNYEIQAKMCEIQINKIQKLKEYEEKLDYIISIQNQLIEKLEDINNQLANNLKESKSKGEINIDEEEMKKNIKDAETHFDKLENLIINNFSKENNGFNEIKLVNEIASNKQSLFFEVIEKIYSPLKSMNEEYQKLMFKNFMTSDLNNKKK